MATIITRVTFPPKNNSLAAEQFNLLLYLQKAERAEAGCGSPPRDIFRQSYHRRISLASVQKCLRNNMIKEIKMWSDLTRGAANAQISPILRFLPAQSQFRRGWEMQVLLYFRMKWETNKCEETNVGGREQIRCRGRCHRCRRRILLLHGCRLIPSLQINNTNKNRNPHLKGFHHSAVFQVSFARWASLFCCF